MTVKAVSTVFTCSLSQDAMYAKSETKVFTRGGMHNEGVPLHSNVMPILVVAQCY